MNPCSPDTAPRLAIVVTHPIQHFAPLYRELEATGAVDLRVFFCCDWGVRSYFDPAFGREVEWDVPLLDGYAHEFLPIARRPRSISFLEVDNPEVGTRLAAYRPDVVLVHGYGCRTMWRAVSWARKNGSVALLSSDSHAGRRISAWKGLLKRAVVGTFYGKLDGALTVGESNREYHFRFGLPPERLYPWTLPVDGSRLAADVAARETLRRSLRERFRIPEGDLVALFCGNLTPWKRPLDFAKAVVAARRAGGAVRGLVVGDGPERAGLESYLSGVEEPGVTLAGFVNQAEIGAYYAAADALVLTSDRDAHPLVVTEALFFSLPVVLSDAIGCIGAGDTARPGENAVVFPCGDVERLGAELLGLERDEVRRSALGEASGRVASANDAQSSARLLVEAVRGAVAAGRRGRPVRRYSGSDA